ncbi:nitroreductase/quinone reductase family protein [Streptomyces sp. NPDC048282]|uniref:nitroreductase/quinone reductase family protein n=1 Tax=Streptomyces sp. NPDC048282 TaxID=3365528 RepID=UPI00370FBEFF
MTTTDDSGGHAVDSWPELRWGRSGTALSRAAVRLAATRPGTWAMMRGRGLDRRILLRTRGRRTLLGPIGAPLLLLVTTGRRSGRPRTTALVYHRVGHELFVVGSNYGQTHDPLWCANLRALPQAVVIMAGRHTPVRAVEVSGPRKDRLYEDFVQLADVYRAYRGRAGRDIPMFALERTAVSP